MNDRYELFGGILYNTPVDDTNDSIKSNYYNNAVELADKLLEVKSLDEIPNIINTTNVDLTNYMNSPLIDFLTKTKLNDYLYEAGKSCNFNIIKYLIEHSGDVRNADHITHGPLYCAATRGRVDIVKYLVERGANINIGDHAILRHTCSSSGNLEVVKYLLENGADIHYDDDIAFRFAAEYSDDVELVRYLVEKGANINASNGYALYWAVYRCRLETVKYLVEQGAHTNKIPIDENFVYGFGYPTSDKVKELYDYLKTHM